MTVAAGERPLLPGCSWRPWLDPMEPTTWGFTAGPRYGAERADRRGRVRVNLNPRHPYAYRAGWQYRYRLVAAYALQTRGGFAGIGDHVDHIDGVIDHDEAENLRVMTAEYHGRLHASLFVVAGHCSRRGFVPFEEPFAAAVARYGPILSARGFWADGSLKAVTLARVEQLMQAPGADRSLVRRLTA